ncbi:hypothetical protein DL1_09085 [Thioclava dalianensis]|uniref:O-antigen ligase-related domain-containing protein n=1 Tax=Thioclava dalianensis TaxID=1185766 RepID=A0A074TF17_9RHOB|nr:O-antigen ligase family protein [Thioclava dalianensis]KEP68730.1 hypothetical protein DL1_09085 [Thioclava dalianensis]SFN59138.1 O-Antigen ligase [Thioclava dalianensis]
MSGAVALPTRALTRDGLALAVFCAAISCLFVVIVQPAPSDLLFVVALGVILSGGRMELSQHLRGVFVLLAVFLLSNLVSGLAWRSVGFGAQYLGITLYMLAIPLVMAHLGARGGARACDRIYGAFFWAASLSALLGALALTHLAPGPVDLYFRSDEGLRLSPLFKDPNVFGPFMGAAGLLLAGHAMRASTRRRGLRLVQAVVLMAMMVLSFSRGAWLGTAVAAACFGVLMICLTRNRRSFVVFALSATLGLGLAVLAAALMLRELGLSEFLMHRLALQSYDAHRFANWSQALEVIAQRPFGVGPGHYVGRTHFAQSEFGLATHNLYLKVAVENGWLGWLSFFGAIALLCTQLLRRLAICDDRQPLRIALLSVILGQLANSVVVDSLHWRHLFVLLGFACCEVVVAARARQGGPGV